MYHSNVHPRTPWSKSVTFWVHCIDASSNGATYDPLNTEVYRNKISACIKKFNYNESCPYSRVLLCLCVQIGSGDLGEPCINRGYAQLGL